jgi:multiple sugar transport system permease protein
VIIGSTHRRGEAHPSPRRYPRRRDADRGHALSRRNRVGLAFTVPTLLFVVIVMAYPLVYLGYLSFNTYRPLSSNEVVPAGFSNFITLATDSTVTSSLLVTLQFTVASVFIEIVVGTVCAVLLANVMLGTRSRAGRVYARVLGSAYIIPFAVPAIAGAYAWRMLLDTQFGPINAALGSRTPWLVDFPLLSIIVIDAWKMTPFVIFVLLAAVMSIEPTQYEAAAIDGAGSLRQFFSITIPSILPVLVITAAFRAVDAFTKVFDTVFATTAGGPGDETRVLPLLTWRTAFTHLDFGSASAQAVLALGISLIFGAALLISQRRVAR